MGHVIPAADEERTFKVMFKSNKRKTGAGFRCQVGFISSVCYFFVPIQIAAVPPTTGTGTGTGTGSGSGSSCMTIDGPANGSSCVFPFNYMDTTINTCTTIDGDERPWCSTQVDENGDHVANVGAWGYCDASCPGNPVTLITMLT